MPSYGYSFRMQVLISYEELQRGQTHGQSEVAKHISQQGLDWEQFAFPVNRMRF